MKSVAPWRQGRVFESRQERQCCKERGAKGANSNRARSATFRKRTLPLLFLQICLDDKSF